MTAAELAAVFPCPNPGPRPHKRADGHTNGCCAAHYRYLQRIEEYLAANGDYRPLAQIARRLGVTPRTISRIRADLRPLREENNR